jgi:hypothetical protein
MNPSDPCLFNIFQVASRGVPNIQKMDLNCIKAAICTAFAARFNGLACGHLGALLRPGSLRTAGAGQRPGAPC